MAGKPSTKTLLWDGLFVYNMDTNVKYYLFYKQIVGNHNGYIPV